MKPTLEEAFNECKSPSDVCDVVKKNMREESMATEDIPIVDVWNRGYADCDEFATLVKYGCDKIGVQCDVYFYYPMFKMVLGHAINAGDWNGIKWVASMAEYSVLKKNSTVDSYAKRILNTRNVLSRKI